MVMGPQIVTAIFLTTSDRPRSNSLAMLLGVFLAASLGVLIWFELGNVIGLEPQQNRTGPTTADYVVSGLLAVLAIRIWRNRGEAEVPKWMSALQQAEPKRAFALGFVLILLMPTDIVATIAATSYLHRVGLDAIDAWALVGGTVLLMALPFLAYTALGDRAKRAMPKLRGWLTTNSWLVNLIVIAYFIFQLLR